MIDKSAIDEVKYYTSKGKDVPSSIAHILVMACIDENAKQSQKQVWACNSEQEK